MTINRIPPRNYRTESRRHLCNVFSGGRVGRQDNAREGRVREQRQRRKKGKNERMERRRRERIRKKKKKESARGRRMVVVVAVVGRRREIITIAFFGGDTSKNGLARRSQKGQAGLTTLGTGDHVPDSEASGCVDIYTLYNKGVYGSLYI